MGVIPSISKGFSTTFKSIALVLILFAFGFAWNLVNLPFAEKLNAPNPDLSTSVTVVALSLVFILMSIFMQAGSLGFIRDQVKQGTASLGGFTASGSRYYLRLLLLGLLVAAIIGVFVLLAVILAAVFSANDSLAMVGLILGLLVASAGIYVVLLLFLAPYVVVTKELTVMASVKESVATVRKNVLSVLGIGVILLVIGFVVGVVLGLISGAVSGDAAAATTIGPAQIAVGAAISFVNAFLGVLVTASYMNFYLGLSSEVNSNI